MVDHYTTELIKATLMLHTIQADRNRLDLVLELQRFLIRHITRLERRVTRVKRAAANMRNMLANGRPTSEKAKEFKARIKDSSALLERLRKKMFVWRCYGDGIAFAYQSKYSLKHLFFDQDYLVKQTPGTLSGKTGFKLEWKIVKLGIKMGVPVVLSDITNVLRTGDVCALGGSDPFPVELKSGRSRNNRTDRQFSNLQELGKFFQNDGAENFRGCINVVRAELRHTEVNHLKAINICIAESRATGIASIEPEPGLRYFAIRDFFSGEKISQEFDRHLTKYTIPTSLTPNAGWLPAQPFTLSLNSANLIEFIQGKVVMVVLVDALVMKGLFKDLGIHSTMVMDRSCSIQICKNPENLMQGVFRLSDLIFGRIATEFQSLAWFVREHASALLDMKPLPALSLEEALKLPGACQSAPEEWVGAKDFYDVAGRLPPGASTSDDPL